MAENSLKMYLKNVYAMEKAVYLQEEVCKEILSRRNRLKNWKPQAMKKVASEDIKIQCYGSGRGADIFAGVCFIGGCILAVMSLLKFNILGTLFWFFAGIGGILVCGYCIKPELEKSEYERLYKEQRIKIDAENTNIEAMNMVAKIEIDRKIKALDAEYSVAKQQLDETKNILHKMYNKAIIFPKYRNFTAVSSFYEYIDSGRCTRLDGHEGAYNIFENEIRQNIIIQKLDEAVRMLKKIEQNQYMLYDAIRETNRVISSLGQNLDSALNQIDTKMDAVVENTYISSYNSQRQLDNSRFQTSLAINYLLF